MNHEIIKLVSEALSLIIQIGSVAALLYALSRFIGTPNRTQNERLEALELWQKEVDQRLEDGANHFEEVDEASAYTLGALIALMDAQISGNNKDELRKQKNQINTYLANRGRRKEIK